MGEINGQNPIKSVEIKASNDRFDIKLSIYNDEYRRIDTKEYNRYEFYIVDAGTGVKYSLQKLKLHDQVEDNKLVLSSIQALSYHYIEVHYRLHWYQRIHSLFTKKDLIVYRSKIFGSKAPSERESDELKSEQERQDL